MLRSNRGSDECIQHTYCVTQTRKPTMAQIAKVICKPRRKRFLKNSPPVLMLQHKWFLKRTLFFHQHPHPAPPKRSLHVKTVCPGGHTDSLSTESTDNYQLIHAFSRVPVNFSTFTKLSLIAMDSQATWVKPNVWMEAPAVWIGNARWRVKTTATTHSLCWKDPSRSLAQTCGINRL